MSPPDRTARGLHIRFFRMALRRILAALGPWFIALGMLILRATCRVRLHSDPRPNLRADGASLCILSFARSSDRSGNLRRSWHGRDGLSVEGRRFCGARFKASGIKTIRGSSRRSGKDKGGLSALSNLVEHVRTGHPAYLAVDGPRGPRNRVHKGIAVLSQQTGAAVLNVVAVPTRRWIFKRSWDRFQIPKPFCRIDISFAEPIWPQQDEPIELYRRRIEQSLCQLELLGDPAEVENAEACEQYHQRKVAPASSAA